MSEQQSGIGELLDLAGGDATFIKQLEKLRRTITVMFTDIQGSTAYFEKYGDAAGLVMVHHCINTLHTIVHRHRGRVIKTLGDGMLVTFEDCAASIEAAVRMQCTLAGLNILHRESDRVAIRIGIHYGTGIVRSQDVFGDVVNVASRVVGLASPGQIVISDTLCQEVRNREFELRNLGRFVLRGKKSECTLYEVLWNQARLGNAIGDRTPEESSAC